MPVVVKKNALIFSQKKGLNSALINTEKVGECEEDKGKLEGECDRYEERW